MLINLSSVLLPILSVISLLVSVGVAIGAFRSGYGQGVSTIHEKVIDALKDQVETLEKQNEQQQKMLDRQEFELQAMRDALKDEGIYITVDGERITIKDMREPNVTRHVIKRPTHKTTSLIKKAEEGK
jgi:hypothetical protein